MRGWAMLLVGCTGEKNGTGTEVPIVPAETADADGDGFALDDGDCDDAVPTINPAATDLVGDGFDQNCDGADGVDADGDGVASLTSGGTDCDDANGAVSAPVDADLDGQTGCDGDCDDANPGRFSGNTEVCNGVDDDCANDVDHDAAGLDVCAREEEVFGTSGKLDLLFVVDDSCSMGPEQADLADAASIILDPLLGLGGDLVHVGVVTTDMDNPAKSGRLRTAGGVRYIDAATPTPEEVFAQMVSAGTTGSGNEAGLAAAYTAIAVLGTGYNAGFERPEADLAIVVVSDEPDYSTQIDAAAFDAWFEGYKQPAAVTSFHAIVDANVGQEYGDVAAAQGGITLTITDSNWTGDLDTIVDAILPGPANVFALAEAPDPATLALEVTEPLGAVVIPVVGTDFDYDPTAIAVVFHGNGYVPPVGSVVVATYRAAP